MDRPTRVLLGLVGETPVVDAFPLGPRLAARLRGRDWPAGLQVEVEGMNWGALHVVQGLEGRRVAFDRVVLVACVQRGGASGRVRLGRWAHETLPTLALQERMFEAVTGIVSLDNLLVIGEHFGVWPVEVLTVEVEAPQALFGEMVTALAERAAAGPPGAAVAPPPWERLVGFDPEAVLQTLEEAVLFAVQGRGAEGTAAAAGGGGAIGGATCGAIGGATEDAVGGATEDAVGPFTWEHRGTATMMSAERWHITSPVSPPLVH